MGSGEFSVYEALGIVFITSFAIQQVLQILDPLVMVAIAKIKADRTRKNKPTALPGGMTDENFKKSLMYALSFLLGLIIVLLAGIRLLDYVLPEWGGGFADVVVSALVIGSGTEGVNTFLKLLGYVKDSQNPAYKFLDVSILIQPLDVSVAPNGTIQFYAVVNNTTNNLVRWEVVQGAAGGAISNTGLYTAPAAAGTYQVRAISEADTTKTSYATVRVGT